MAFKLSSLGPILQSTPNNLKARKLESRANSVYDFINYILSNSNSRMFFSFRNCSLGSAMVDPSVIMSRLGNLNHALTENKI